MQKFRSGDDVISGDLQILRCVTLLTIVSGVVATSTSETTYLQYLNGTLTALVSICQFTFQLLYSATRYFTCCYDTVQRQIYTPGVVLNTNIGSGLWPLVSFSFTFRCW